MRYLRLTGIIVLAIFCGLCVLVASSDDSLESFDPYLPATLLPIVAKRLNTLRSQARELRLGELLDAAIAAFQDRVRHGGPAESPSR